MKLKKIVFVNGCFDILHPGHIKLFEEASKLGDYVIVAIDSDRKVKEMKGQGRPFNPVQTRKTMLECIRYIDKVLIFDTKEELEQLIKESKVDVLLVGSDWKGKEVVGAAHAKHVKFFGRVGDYSTTKIIEDLAHR